MITYPMTSIKQSKLRFGRVRALPKASFKLAQQCLTDMFDRGESCSSWLALSMDVLLALCEFFLLSLVGDGSR